MKIKTGYKGVYFDSVPFGRMVKGGRPSHKKFRYAFTFKGKTYNGRRWETARQSAIDLDKKYIDLRLIHKLQIFKQS